MKRQEWMEQKENAKPGPYRTPDCLLQYRMYQETSYRYYLQRHPAPARWHDWLQCHAGKSHPVKFSVKSSTLIDTRSFCLGVEHRQNATPLALHTFKIRSGEWISSGRASSRGWPMGSGCKAYNLASETGDWRSYEEVRGLGYGHGHGQLRTLVSMSQRTSFGGLVSQ